MKVELSAIEALAPDQPSLKAAAGLMKPNKWSNAGISADSRLIWAACAGSGANPYLVMADLSDMGSKCTCPSRKFPCKHVLALLWMRADNSLSLQTGETPDWVSEWLSRRRKPGFNSGVNPTAPTAAALEQSKDMSAATLAEHQTADDPKAIARRSAAAEKRAAETDQALLDAVAGLEGWIGDQLRLGLASFIDDATARCRRIAARLVDGKAATLAGRIDELPARLLSLPVGDRVRGAVIELGKLVLLVRAYRAEPKNAAIRRSISTTENRDTLLENPETLRFTSAWEVLGEKVETRRDGLISHTSWLLNLGETGPQFAVLLDYYPASAGKRSSAFTIGEQFEGELVFYPGQTPSRALLLSRTSLGDKSPKWPAATNGTIASLIAHQLHQEPWLLEVPVLLPEGRLKIDDHGAPWWFSSSSNDLLRVQNAVNGPMMGTNLERAAAVWSMGGVRLLAAQTKWGRVNCVS
jgi:SWIM zinc finger